MSNLGFGSSPQPTKIYIGKEGSALWYFFNEQPVAITHSALTGYLRGVSTREYTGDYGISQKLLLTIEADKVYEIQTGLETWFAKTVLRNLSGLSNEALTRQITFEPYSTDNTKRVIFCNIYDWSGKKVFVPWKDEQGNKLKEPNYEELYQLLSKRIDNNAIDPLLLEKENDRHSDRNPSVDMTSFEDLQGAKKLNAILSNDPADIPF